MEAAGVREEEYRTEMEQISFHLPYPDSSLEWLRSVAKSGNLLFCTAPGGLLVCADVTNYGLSAGGTPLKVN